MIFSALIGTLTFTLSFITLFKFDKKIECTLIKSESNNYLIVNKQVHQNLATNGITQFEYDEKMIQVQYKYYYQSDQLYYYLTDLNFSFNGSKKCYYLLKNLSLFSYLN